MNSYSPASESGVVEELSRHLGKLGWSAVQGIAPAAWEPNLVATDSRGTLLCIELKAGSGPLHSRVLSTLTEAQSDLSATWPGRSIVALLTTNPASERLQSALSSTGIVFVQVEQTE